MEPFIILAIAAALLVVFYGVWNNRSKPTESRPEDETHVVERRRDGD